MISRIDNRCSLPTETCDTGVGGARTPGTIYVDATLPTSFDLSLFYGIIPTCNDPITCYLCDGAIYNSINYDVTKCYP